MEIKLSRIKFTKYLKWIGVAVLVGVGSGIASGLFLLMLEKATQTREAHPILLWGLPLGGAFVGWLYHRYGRSVEGGNNLIIDEFHDPKAVVPFRMAPLVLLGTVVTHLFGGSAGREGTAVQMGGSIADQFTHYFKNTRFKINTGERRALLMVGMSAGFGSVFGVPFAGTLFGLEVLAIGKLHLWAVVECAIAAFIAHFVTLSLGVHHAVYDHPQAVSISFLGIGSAVVAGIAFGLAARMFARSADAVSRVSKKYFPLLPLRILIGGAVVTAIFMTIPLSLRYAGLGVPIIIEAIQHPLPHYDWIGKLVMTALTLGVGYKGGEVTPLLFVGAALGNSLSAILPGIPLPMMAAMGFVGVFAGAANTPFACTVMAMELFGPQVGVFAAIACFSSYFVSGHHGIYHAQRVHRPKNRLLRKRIGTPSA